MKASHWEAMEAHVIECLPNEACGILGGQKQTISIVIPVTNELHSPYRFRMNAAEQLRAMQKLETMEYAMIGIYHSHPLGPEVPSETDLEESYYPQVAYLVWAPSRDGWTCRSFRLIDGDSIEIPLHVIQK